MQHPAREELDDLLVLARRLSAQAPAGAEWSVRLVARAGESLAVRRGVVQPPRLSAGRGVCVSVQADGGAGYAGTSDLSPGGLRAAFERAAAWARQCARIGLVDDWHETLSDARGEYLTPVSEDWGAAATGDLLDRLRRLDTSMNLEARIVDTMAWLGWRRDQAVYLNAAGAELVQVRDYLFPGLSATARGQDQTQRCTGGGAGAGRLGGLEQAAVLGREAEADAVARRALDLLSAPECPQARMDLVLLPAQMVLQIHESIGHPLELDRILGDERNYAGTSFVTPEMFGSYRYGSKLLNVCFDPDDPHQLASYGYDDSGLPARRVELIRAGVLLRPLGGSVSAARAGLPALANARASDWNRPPIDRMANLNLEPGATPLAAMIAGIERGVLMDRNRSWSIDDSRNKFQFGCEYGHLINDGELGPLVRNPGYRGVSASFWRSLEAVGPVAERELLGTPNCGKGEPNQLLETGHASPPCRFRDVEVFGG